MAYPKNKYTLEDITLRKQEVLQDIRTQHQILSDTGKQIVAPFMPSSDPMQSTLVKKVNTGMAIFDGVMVGMKIFKSIRNVFRRKR